MHVRVTRRAKLHEVHVDLGRRDLHYFRRCRDVFCRASGLDCHYWIQRECAEETGNISGKTQVREQLTD